MNLFLYRTPTRALLSSSLRRSALTPPRLISFTYHHRLPQRDSPRYPYGPRRQGYWPETSSDLRDPRSTDPRGWREDDARPPTGFVEDSSFPGGSSPRESASRDPPGQTDRTSRWATVDDPRFAAERSWAENGQGEPYPRETEPQWEATRVEFRPTGRVPRRGAADSPPHSGSPRPQWEIVDGPSYGGDQGCVPDEEPYNPRDSGPPAENDGDPDPPAWSNPLTRPGFEHIIRGGKKLIWGPSPSPSIMPISAGNRYMDMGGGGGSSYSSSLTIRNNLGGPLTRKTPAITAFGNPVGTWPSTVASGALSPDINISATNANDGSEGCANYTAQIGGNTAKLTFNFESNNNCTRAWAVTSNDNIIVSTKRDMSKKILTAIFTVDERA